jgi:hypothetical protein
VLRTRVGSLIVHGPQPESDVGGLLRELRAARAEVHYVQADFDGLDEAVSLADRQELLRQWSASNPA